MVSIPNIGVALPAFNDRSRLQSCLAALFLSEGVNLYVCLVDAGSTDGTEEYVRKQFPQVRFLRGDDSYWWTKSVNAAVVECIRAGCVGVVLMNTDVLVQPDAIRIQWMESSARGQAITSPLVLNRDHPEVVWEAGHAWEPVPWLPLVWRSRYLFRHGTPTNKVPERAYSTVSLVGRGGFVPTSAFFELGFFDEHHLPHYGADGELGIRAWRAGYPMFVVPQACVLLDTTKTGTRPPASVRTLPRALVSFLFRRRNGARLTVLYQYSRHTVPGPAAALQYAFTVALNTFRFVQGSRTASKEQCP